MEKQIPRVARNDKRSMKLHILGIAGTFMGGVAALARELGFEVEGSDQNIYPPMSTQLETLGITLKQGYLPDHITADCDDIIIGNALSRGNPAVEAVLDSGRAYTSGAQWLAEHVLPGAWRLRHRSEVDILEFERGEKAPEYREQHQEAEDEDPYHRHPVAEEAAHVESPLRGRLGRQTVGGQGLGLVVRQHVAQRLGCGRADHGLGAVGERARRAPGLPQRRAHRIGGAAHVGLGRIDQDAALQVASQAGPLPRQRGLTRVAPVAPAARHLVADAGELGEAALAARDAVAPLHGDRAGFGQDARVGRAAGTRGERRSAEEDRCRARRDPADHRSPAIR